jgi:Galactose oxidase, central domain
MRLKERKTFVGTMLLVGVTLFTVGCGGGNSSNNGGGGGGESVPQVTHFSITAPADVAPNTFFIVSVSALDSSDETVGNYSGTVHFTSSDPEADLPADTTLNNGAGSFSVTLTTIGIQTIMATDTVKTRITGSSDSIDVSNSLNHGFQPSGDMGTERAAHTATLLANGQVLITGGFNANEILATAEIFDPATGTFTPTGSMTTPRFAHTATCLPTGKCSSQVAPPVPGILPHMMSMPRCAANPRRSARVDPNLRTIL